ncbi:DUF3347 domain-containing protein [Flavobacterium cerinum]|uniref:DUF3347 domain-containing protein n=1 Tax=Flavobacterium cerinum TaxID=2502784 RepID=A0ABY5IWD5_9FLAO|nr:DUF3347 domain-containing protein [Flavobacterium cerinum]UUC47143.1 DUF3347 domain-containing protein [Flavobacterium cerinum]
MKTFKNIFLASIATLFLTSCEAQIKNPKTETVTVYGNCGMCKKTIEKAANEKGIVKADWNIDTDQLTVTFDQTKTNTEAILKKVAYAGYDSDSFRAPDEAYKNLPECCQYDRPVKNNTVADNHTTHTNHDMTAATQNNSVFGAVFNAYFSLKEALIKSDGKMAAAKASELTKAIGSVPMSAIQANQHTVWMKIQNNLKTDAEHIAETNDIKHQRDHFASLSEDLFTLAKLTTKGTTIYYQKCPMYNDGKGAYWLSKENTVKNPYYGSAMLTCGSTVETLKQ